MFRTLRKLFSPFIGTALSVACVGSLLSGLVTYEQNSLLKLVTGSESDIWSQIKIVTSIVGITALSGFRVYGTNYLKHKMYISTVQFFFNNICLQKLEHWDTYYTRSELVKCIHADVSALAESSSRIFSILIRNAIAICITSYLLYKENVLYLVFGGSICILVHFILKNLLRNGKSNLIN